MTVVATNFRCHPSYKLLAIVPVFIFAKFLLASTLNKSEALYCLFCSGTVYENHPNSILGLPRSEGNTRNWRTLPILILCRKNVSISVFFHLGSSNRPQVRNRNRTYGKRVEMWNFRPRKLPCLVQCDWHIVSVGEEVEHVVRVHGPKVGNTCQEKIKKICKQARLIKPRKLLYVFFYILDNW